MIDAMTSKKLIVLTNLSSSTSEDVSAALTSICERYGYARPDHFVGQSNEVDTMMEAMRAARGDLLVAYGGDGTAAAVASIAREQNVPFIALPGGTMNMLMLGLYGTDDWQDCLLRGLACAQPRPMTAGLVSDSEGHTGTFMVGCMFGQPTKMSEAREELRDGNVAAAAREAVDIMRATADEAPMHIALGSGDYDARPYELINVACPFMEGDACDPDQFDLTLFETVRGGSAISLGLAALRGNIRDSQAAETLRSDRFRLKADHAVNALLDGEPHVFHGDVTVQIDTTHGLVMAPWPAQSAPTPTS